MQVADVVFPALGISDQALRFVLFGAIFGFPVALVFGWFYDLGAQGIRRTEAADVDASGGAQALRRTDYVILTALGAVVVAILYNAIGASREAVKCLRRSFEEPSYAMPFIDPFYPHYDSIRDDPEFVELLAEIDVRADAGRD